MAKPPTRQANGARPVRPPKAAAYRGANPRRLALDVLLRVSERGASLDEALTGHPRYNALSERDRGFARVMLATTLRRLSQIDAVLARFATKMPEQARTLAALRLGACQLIYLGTPSHAAVSESVGLIDSARPWDQRFVNAVLRKIAREREQLADEPVEAAPAELSDWLRTALLAAYGAADVQALAAVHSQTPPLDLTPLRDGATWAAELGADLLPNGTLRLAEAGGRIEQLAGFKQGAWIVQDVAASLPVRLLGRVRGQRVLDLCAAPGGKTCQLAAQGARVMAIEQAAKRAELIHDNLRRLRLPGEVKVMDALAYQPETPYSHILLDAPCTATGTIRRHPDIAWGKRAQDVRPLTVLQDKLLAHAFDLLSPGGALVYATCSLLPAEGEERVAALLKARPDAKLLAIKPDEAGGIPLRIDADGCARTFPADLADRGGMDGFFMARIGKSA